MPKNNIDELMSIALHNWTQAELPNLGQVIADGLQGSQPVEAADKATTEADLRAIRNLIERTSAPAATTGRNDVSTIAELQANNRLPAQPAIKAETRTTQTTSKADGNNTGETLLKVAGMVTGLGPLIAGLFGLFGSSNDKPVVEPQPYIAPERVNVEAGIDTRRMFTPISYGQDGVARSVSPSGGVQPRVEIHVNAMDSRSFLDHSDEIARAVQSAMLRSHSLNDVVAEL